VAVWGSITVVAVSWLVSFCSLVTFLCLCAAMAFSVGFRIGIGIFETKDKKFQGQRFEK
jgi:uncharacterized membrane protein